MTTLDLNDLAAGKVEVSTFRQKLAALDLSPYRGQHVQLKGCAPTWAHLMVAVKLIGEASRLDFLLDDGKGGQTIEVWTKTH